MNNLKAYRAQRGLRQSDIAALLDMQPSTYAGYENGSRDPSTDTWRYIADKLSVTVDYLVGLSDDPHAAKHGGRSRVEERYYSLDATGRKLVDAVMTIEGERFQSVVELPPARPSKVIPLFAAAAGPGEPVDGSPLDEYEVDADSPAQFAVRISGDSMQPELIDGQIALCRRKRPEIGEIAVVMVNGFLLVKQYIEDSFGNIYLRSINRARRDLDVDILASGNDTVSGYGTVIHRKLPLVRE